VALTALVFTLVACEGYTQTGAKRVENQGPTGGNLAVQISTANGSVEESIEIEDGSGTTLDARVILTVRKGSYKIELLGADGEVTLSLEAAGNETVTGQGHMAVDSFGEANYRVTAVDAESIEYIIEYTYR
jgi:hypothetical protein